RSYMLPTRNSFEHFSASCTHEPVDTYDFTLTNREVHAINDVSVRLFWIRDHEVFDLEDGFAEVVTRWRRTKIKTLAHHVINNPLQVNFAAITVGGDASISKNDGVVCDFQSLF